MLLLVRKLSQCTGLELVLLCTLSSWRLTVSVDKLDNANRTLMLRPWSPPVMSAPEVLQLLPTSLEWNLPLLKSWTS